MHRNQLNQASTSPRSTLTRLYNAYSRRARVSAAFSCVFLACLFAAFEFSASSVLAAEDWPAFLDALKARGYDDVALVYLKTLRENGGAPPELTDELDYNIGEAAFDAWTTSTSASNRDALAAEAQTAFEKYLAAQPDGLNAVSANLGLARLAIDRGDRAFSAAKKQVGAEDARNAKLLEARSAYSEAKPRLEAGLKLAQAKAKSLQDSGKSNNSEVQAAQGTYLDALIRSATLQAQAARTFPKDDSAYTSGLTKARDNFKKIFTTYGQYLGSFKARYLEAECSRDLDDPDGALSLLDELAVLPDEEQFYGLKTRANLLYAEIAEEKGTPELDMGLLKKYNDWKNVDKLPSEYYESAEGRRLQLAAGRAIVRLEKLRRDDYPAYCLAGVRTFVDSADPLFKTVDIPAAKAARAKNEKTANVGKTNPLIVFGLKTLSELSAGKDSVALEAQTLLKDDLFKGIDVSKYSFAAKVDDFPSAVAAATREAAVFSQARRNYLTAAPDMQSDARKEMEDSGKKAIAALRLAFDWGAKGTRPDRRGKLSSADLEGALEELDKLYLKYAVVCFALERYEDSYVAGEYLARRRPDFSDSSQGALVALRSLQSTIVRLRGQGASSETLDALQSQLNSFADYIEARWGDSQDASIAQEAALVRLDAAVSRGDVASAQSLLEQISETSPRRASAELRLGQALWTEWSSRNAELLAARQSGDSSSASEEEKATLDALLSGARSSLEAGLERMLSSSAGVTEHDYLAIYSTYLLAQAYDRLGDTENAEKWLTHPVIGALSSVERALKGAEEGESHDEDAPEFMNESFQMAVLALSLSVLAASPERLDEAEKTIETLERLASSSSDASGKLTGVYLRLGRRLEERMSELKEAAENGDESKQTELDAVAKGYESFLKRASERREGNDYASLRWIGDSYLALGRGLTGVMSDPPKEALAYFSIAGKTYQSILKQIAEDDSFAPNDTAKLAVDLKIVECLRCACQFEKAFTQLKNAIKENPDNVDVQKEAALIFQDWGRKDSKYYLTAIVGAAPDSKGQNRVWGWNGLIKRVGPSAEQNDRFKTLFYESYLGKTRCRYLYARRIKDEAERNKQAEAAETDLERLFQTRPDLGGPSTFGKFDSAYKNFQKLRGVKAPRGLRESAKKKDAAK